MPYVLGQTKLGGRAKGTPNKRTVDLIETIAAKWPDYHPVVAMAALANDEAVSIEMRFAANKEVAQYFSPKLRAVERTYGAEDTPVSRLTG